MVKHMIKHSQLQFLNNSKNVKHARFCIYHCIPTKCHCITSNVNTILLTIPSNIREYNYTCSETMILKRITLMLACVFGYVNCKING